MGGSITLKTMVATKDIKAGVIWAGVVGSYPDLIERWRRRIGPTPTINPTSQRGRWRRELIEKYGEPSENPEFWDNISAKIFFERVNAAILINHGTADESVPFDWSVNLEQDLKAAGKEVTFYRYEGEKHEFIPQWPLMMQRTLEFFNEHLQ